jgi:hypothetical protein
VVDIDGRLWRFAQTCDPEYGVSVHAFAIEELTSTSYRETPLGCILGPAGCGWNRYGMHHIDPVRSCGQWVASVDGR